MPNEELTAQTTVTTENATEVGSHADTAENHSASSENVNDAVFTDTNGEGGNEAAGQAESRSDKPTQTKEQNAENARRRREAERQAELQETREKAIIDALRGRNPYTGDEMKDSADVAEYLKMREIEDNGGDPINDFARFTKQKEREKAEKEAEAKSQQAWFDKDRADFAEKHPDVNLDALVGDKFFRQYADGKVGKVPLSDIYEGYVAFTDEYAEQAKNKAAQLLANAKATPGALSSADASDSGFYTREQVAKMSPAEVHRNYDKIRESMAHWK